MGCVGKNKKRECKSLISLILTIVFVFVLAITSVGCSPDDSGNSNDSAKESEYSLAIQLLENGDIIGAYEKFISLDGYRDSEKKAKEIFSEYKSEKLTRAKAGDYVFFGAYEQDNDLNNGKEDIEWLVLEKTDGKMFLLSKHGLDSVKYHNTYDNVYWPNCDIYTWLDSEFINNAFNEQERARISLTTMTVEENKNPDYGARPGWTNTQGKVFLLTLSQAEQYFSTVNARKCSPTAYAIAQGVSTKAGSSGCWWWLRTPGGYQNFASDVSYSGGIESLGKQVNEPGGAVRPAMWINC